MWWSYPQKRWYNLPQSIKGYRSKGSGMVFDSRWASFGWLKSRALGVLHLRVWDVPVPLATWPQVIGFQASGYHPTPKSIISKDCCIEFLTVLTSPLLGSCYRHHCQFDGWLTKQVCPTHLLEGAAKRIFVSSSACGPDASESVQRAQLASGNNRTWQWRSIYKWVSHSNPDSWGIFHCHVWLPEGSPQKNCKSVGSYDAYDNLCGYVFIFGDEDPWKSSYLFWCEIQGMVCWIWSIFDRQICTVTPSHHPGPSQANALDGALYKPFQWWVRWLRLLTAQGLEVWDCLEHFKKMTIRDRPLNGWVCCGVVIWWYLMLLCFSRTFAMIQCPTLW